MEMTGIRELVQYYKALLVHREYSHSTIQKYTRVLARFFCETKAPAQPPREVVAA